MLTALRRHPIPIQAFFRFSLVLTYAFPEALLRPLLPRGLVLDTFEGYGFLAIAMVQTERLRPVGLPAWLGRSFFLVGYRLFCRFTQRDGRTLRGLYILRSDADSRLMVAGGNLMTHYNYQHCRAEIRRSEGELAVRIATPEARADLDVRASLGVPVDAPPPGSPFPDLKTARRFAGPMPFTFDHEAATQSMVVVQGVRENWNPAPVRVQVERCTFLEQQPFSGAPARLANAFLIEAIPYRWKRGVLMELPEAGA